MTPAWEAMLPSSARLRIIGLIAFAMAPIIGLAGWDMAQRRAETAAHIGASVRATAHTVAQNLADQIVATKGLLAVLAPAIAEARTDAAACARLLALAVEANPHHDVLSLVEAGDAVRCASRPFAQPAVLWGAEPFRTAPQAVAPVGGALIVVSHRLAGPEGALLTAGLDLSRFGGGAERARLPNGGVMALFDRDGTVIARAPAEPGWVGRSVADSGVFAAARGDAEVLAETRGFDGAPVLAAVAPVPEVGGRGLFVSVAVPAAAVHGPIDGALGHGLAAFGMALAVSGGIAVWMVRRTILIPLARLGQAVAGVAAGDDAARAGPDYPTGDTGKLLRGFDALADRLQARGRAVQDGEERFHLATLAAEDGIWDWDLRTGAVRFSPRCRAMLGYTADELPDRFDAWSTVILDEDRAVALALLDDYNAGRAPEFRAALRFRHKDGSVRLIEVHAIHQKDDGGAVARLVGANTDITEARRTREQLDGGRRLLETIAWAHTAFFQEPHMTRLAASLLDRFVTLTGSAYGFIGEVLTAEDGSPYLHTFALTNISWNDETEALYAEKAAMGFEFRRIDTLYGAVLKSGDIVIANQPASDPRSGGLPAGHPPLSTFLGLPLRSGERMIGVVGLANRWGGYDSELVAFLAPLAATCGVLIEARRAAMPAAGFR